MKRNFDLTRTVSLDSSESGPRDSFPPEVTPWEEDDASLSQLEETPRHTKRSLTFLEDDTEDVASPVAQTPEVFYTPSSQVDPTIVDDTRRIHDAIDATILFPVAIGSDPSNDVTASNRCVNSQYARLTTNEYLMKLQDIKPCWYFRDGRSCVRLDAAHTHTLSHDELFRLLPASKDARANGLRNEFRDMHLLGTNDLLGTSAKGSESFDRQYLTLLDRIFAEGHRETNKKGPNVTLRDPVTLKIDLSSDDNDKNVVPITTLRNLFAGGGSIIEALWYLRGEPDIKFLQANRCNFWDAQADGDGFLGLNYGLLTNFPTETGTSLNQLEKNVIDKLCRDESSRNMTCTLLNPSEYTIQNACSSEIQFSVSNSDTLDLTVTQRSSDVILGLPHDVLVWSIIFHLVRREVRLRSQRVLKAGRLYFCINGGAAHVYDQNQANMKELLTRSPYPDEHLLHIDSSEGMFDLAKNFKRRGGSSHLYISNYVRYGEIIRIEQAVEKQR